MAEEPLAIFWSPAALRDLDRFAEVLHEGNPQLAARIAEAVDAAVAILADLPMMGRRIPGASAGSLRRSASHIDAVTMMTMPVVRAVRMSEPAVVAAHLRLIEALRA